MSTPDDVAGLIHCVLVTYPTDLRGKYQGFTGMPLNDAMRILQIKDLKELPDRFPDMFAFRGGQLTAVQTEEMSNVVEHMDKTVPKNGKSRGRGGGGGFRGGRAGGTSGRGGYGAAFSTAPRGARGGTSGYRGSSRGGGGFGGSGGGFGGSGGGGGGGFGNSGFGGSSQGFGGSVGRAFGASRAPEPASGFGGARRNESPPPRNNYPSSRGEDNYRSDNHGFASNYDDFAETSRRGNDDYDDRRGREERPAYRNDDYYGNDGYDRDSSRRQDRDRDYDSGRGTRDDGYAGMHVTRTISNDLYDRRNDDYGRDERRREDSRDRDGGYRTRRYSEDEDDYHGRRRSVERDYRGRGEAQYNQRRNSADEYDDYHPRPHQEAERRRDDRYYDEEEEEPAQRKAFPSALGGGGGSGPGSVRSSVFAPHPMRSANDSPRSGREPEDPVQEREREPCLPTNPYISMPPGLEEAILRNAAPPGLNYPVGPPPGLNLPPMDPIKKTPTQRDQEKDPREVSLEELCYLIYQACEKEGGKDVPNDQIVGKVLTHCDRDIANVVRERGGITRVLENVCKRAFDRLEFCTDDDGNDVIGLKNPYKQRAIERYGSSNDVMGPPDDVPDDDDEESNASYGTARSSNKAMSMASSAAPVAGEIRVANDLWTYARTHGAYRSAMQGYGVTILTAAEWYKRMSPQQLCKFVMRHEFKPFFALEFVDSSNWMFAVGEAGPLEVLAGERPVDRTMREDSIASSTRGSGLRQQRNERDAEGDFSRPSSFTFYHKRDDPERGYNTARKYISQEQVIMTHFHDFDEIYVMTTRDHANRDTFSRDLFDDHCSLVFCDTEYWKKGHVGCFLLPKEKAAHRISVMGVNHEARELRVRFVDSGEQRWIDVRDAVPLKDSYKTHALVFHCSLEDYDPLEEDALWDIRSAMMKCRDMPVVIEPLEKRPEECVLIVSLEFTPPSGMGQKKCYPEDWYKKGLAKPKATPRRN